MRLPGSWFEAWTELRRHPCLVRFSGATSFQKREPCVSGCSPPNPTLFCITIIQHRENYLAKKRFLKPSPRQILQIPQYGEAPNHPYDDAFDNQGAALLGPSFSMCRSLPYYPALLNIPAFFISLQTNSGAR